jgi:hypothetical protein
LSCFALNTLLKRIVVNIAWPFFKSERSNRHLLIGMDHFTKRMPKLTTISVASRSRENYKATRTGLSSRGSQKCCSAGSKKDTGHSTSPAVRLHGGTIREDSWVVPVKGLPAGLQGGTPRDCRHDAHQHGVRLLWDLLFRLTPDRELSTTDKAVGVVDPLHGIYR